MSQDNQKQAVALAALDFVLPKLETSTLVGIGTGSTASHFIHALAKHKNAFLGAVSSSQASTDLLTHYGITVYDLNDIEQLPFYIDGADEINTQLHMIKGGGAALTREKIITACAQHYVCIADSSKLVDTLGAFALPVEVIPMARNYVMRELAKLGGNPVYREDCVTDNGGDIIDVHGLSITDARTLEQHINNITGVITNGLFAIKPADTLLIASEQGVHTLHAV